MTTRILYNANCPICNAEICHYQRYADAQDIPFGFDDLNTVDPAAYGVTADQAARRLHVLHDGQVIAGVDLADDAAVSALGLVGVIASDFANVTGDL